MKISNTEVFGFNAAIRGMRNPMNSWERSDSFIDQDSELFGDYNTESFILGNNDINLAQNLIIAGPEHCKFLRMIQVWVDMELPRYIWSEFDTYKYNTKNSCSTMHKIMSRPLTINDFEVDKSNAIESASIKHSIEVINSIIDLQDKTKNCITKDKALITIKRILPESFLQKRTINTNYAELRNIYHQRHNHKLKEWHKICDWIEKLPYARELIIK